ncbi:hypothetical protein [uncultured Roseibium sp.]|uniref:hypothetical protein n=1 Tax=uncultured Roseibium sp. TaxID=1936171 RepID=UPI003217E313
MQQYYAYRTRTGADTLACANWLEDHFDTRVLCPFSVRDTKSGEEIEYAVLSGYVFVPTDIAPRLIIDSPTTCYALATIGQLPIVVTEEDFDPLVEAIESGELDRIGRARNLPRGTAVLVEWAGLTRLAIVEDVDGLGNHTVAAKVHNHDDSEHVIRHQFQREDLTPADTITLNCRRVPTKHTEGAKRAKHAASNHQAKPVRQYESEKRPAHRGINAQRPTLKIKVPA